MPRKIPTIADPQMPYQEDLSSVPSASLEEKLPRSVPLSTHVSTATTPRSRSGEILPRSDTIPPGLEEQPAAQQPTRSWGDATNVGRHASGWGASSHDLDRPVYDSSLAAAGVTPVPMGGSRIDLARTHRVCIRVVRVTYTPMRPCLRTVAIHLSYEICTAWPLRRRRVQD